MFYKLALILLSTLLLFSACSSKKKHKPKPPIINTNSNIKHQALIMGVSDYAGENNDLSGIDLDVSKMKNLFSSWGFEVQTLSNSLQFEQIMKNYAKTLSKDDVFILYYSGHGSHTPDTSHDEVDGEDELIVLSDSKTNLYLLDDKINILLNNIKADKLIIFDSCNSGTAIKRYIPKDMAKYQVKYIDAPQSAADDSPQNKSIPNTNMQGNYLFFAACQDYEQSLASKSGSLFTNTFINQVSLNDNVSLIHQKTLDHLQDYFHPKLTTSTPSLKNKTLKSFLKLE